MEQDSDLPDFFLCAVLESLEKGVLVEEPLAGEVGDGTGDPEDAVNGTCEKFIRRFRAVENGAAAQGREVSQLSLEEMTALWNEAKRS